MSKVGRPTDYKPEYVEQAFKLCLLGHIDEELAKYFEVEVSTLNNWKSKFPEFMEAIKAGREDADSNVTVSLYKRAMGYEHPSEEIKVINDGVLGQYIERVPIIKKYPPDATAMIFWLKNRQRLKWRDKIETEHSGTIQITPIAGMQIT